MLQPRRQQPLPQVGRHHDGGRQFHDLRGLKAESANAEPALCPHGADAQHQHQYQQQNTAAVHPGRQATQQMGGHLSGNEHGDEGHQKIGTLALNARH